ncbi:MAG: ABC-2 transporter permease [Candidatus Delongbacteria bacterium]|nr:ABC-2 transporter permease [Candidatus Delongbacteria bacterium]
MIKSLRLMMIYLVNMRYHLAINLALLMVLLAWFGYLHRENPFYQLMASFFLCSFFLPYTIVSRLVDYEEKNHTLVMVMTSPLGRKVVAASRFMLPIVLRLIITLFHILLVTGFRFYFDIEWGTMLMVFGLISVLTMIFDYLILLLAEYMEIMTVLQVARFLPFGIVLVSLGLKSISRSGMELIPWYIYLGGLGLGWLTIMIWGWKRFLGRHEWK